MKHTQGKIIIVTAILVVLACFFAVYLRLYTGKELWYEMFAAVLGVIITAVITMILLRGQSDTDIQREREAKIFEEKLRIYQEYLRTLCEVVEDGSLSEEDKNRLEFQTSYVAMHCRPEHIAKVSQGVKELIAYTCPDKKKLEIGKLNRSNSPDPVLDSLFDIVEAFRQDLYGSDFSFEEKSRTATLVSFSEAYRNAKSPGGEWQEETPVSEDHALWEEALSRWKAAGWQLENTDDGFWMTNGNGNPGAISLGFYEEHYYIQAEYPGDSDFAKPLKWEYGGRRSRGTWWVYLDEPYYSLAEGKWAEAIRTDGNLQQYVIGKVTELQDVLNCHHRTRMWKDRVGEHEGWNVYIWYWKMLACQWETDASKSEGTLYMDIIENEKHQVLIQLGNRQGDDEELLRKTLKRIQYPHPAQPKEPSGYLLLETVDTTDADTVAARVKYWMEQLGKNG